MKNKSGIYKIIDIMVLLVTIMLFLKEYNRIKYIFSCINIFNILAIISTVIIVHIIKALRLYLALYGSNLGFLEYIKVYCKVTPVSLFFPYKTGDFFRMYSYGKKLDNIFKGIIILLLDRFMDTMALVTMIIFVWIFTGGKITLLVYLFTLFIVFTILIYFVFPGMYKFWKRYFLFERATERRIIALKLLEACNYLYSELKEITRGRGLILYFLSLVAWGVEILSLTMQVGIFKNENLSNIISKYLFVAIGYGRCIELNLFVIISAIAMLVIYIFVNILGIFLRKGHK